MTHDAEHRIRERAYHMWEAAGRPHGREHDFWRDAAAEEHAQAAKTQPAHTAAEPAAPSPAKLAKPAKKATAAKDPPVKVTPAAKAKSSKKSG